MSKVLKRKAEDGSKIVKIDENHGEAEAFEEADVKSKEEEELEAFLFSSSKCLDVIVS